MGNADLVILNTCHIREKAAEKVYSDLGRIRDIKDARKQGGKETVIAVAGCVAQAEGSEITRRQPAVDLVIGPQSYHRLPELIVRAETKNESIVETEFPGDENFAAHESAAPRLFAVSVSHRPGRLRQVLHVLRSTVYARRGILASPAKLEAEARELATAGAKELVLLGQNVNAYHGEGPVGAPSGSRS